MPELFSKDRRIIWSRRIKGFWEEFSHNRIGFVGLLLLFVFVFMAIFAPWLTPYDPVAAPRVAESFAMPDWMTVFPQYREYPRTLEAYPEWTVQKGSEFVVGGKEAEGFIHLERYMRTVDVTLTSSFDHTSPIQPSRFLSSFELRMKNVTDFWWSAELLLTNPNGNTTRIWFEPYSNRSASVFGMLDSSDYWLVKGLGYTDPKATNLARIIFANPVKGQYGLTFHVSLRPEEGTQAAKAYMKFENFDFVVPGLVHGILGADFAGTDVLTQVIYGSRISLAIGLMAAAISTSMGVMIGTISGYSGGTVDEVIMRIVDILLCLPTLPLLLTLVRLFGKNVFYIVLFISIFGWLGLSRVVRSQVLSLRETAFVECATASGASKPYIVVKHLIPNIVPIALASLVLHVPGAILSEASLSFLGFGDPRVPTWGKMLNYAFGHGAFENFAWWWAIPPGLAITLISLSFVFMGFAIDEIVNPRLRRRR